MYSWINVEEKVDLSDIDTEDYRSVKAIRYSDPAEDSYKLPDANIIFEGSTPSEFLDGIRGSAKLVYGNLQTGSFQTEDVEVEVDKEIEEDLNQIESVLQGREVDTSYWSMFKNRERIGENWEGKSTPVAIEPRNVEGLKKLNYMPGEQIELLENSDEVIVLDEDVVPEERNFPDRKLMRNDLARQLENGQEPPIETRFGEEIDSGQWNTVEVQKDEPRIVGIAEALSRAGYDVIRKIYGEEAHPGQVSQRYEKKEV